MHVIVTLTIYNVREQFDATIGRDPARSLHALVFHQGFGVAESVRIRVDLLWSPPTIRDFKGPGSLADQLLLKEGTVAGVGGIV